MAAAEMKGQWRRRQKVSGATIASLLASTVLLTAVSTTLGWAQDLPGCARDTAPAQIEVLPFETTGIIRADVDGVVDRYGGATCRVPDVDYLGAEAVYKVWLHEGNKNIRFFLDVQGQDTDLMLALVKCRGRGETCDRSSLDFIGSRDEEIKLEPGKPAGYYYLYIDSVEGRGGPYKLTVDGENPTPNLKLQMTAVPNPVIPGRELTYRLTVNNEGTLPASNVKIRQMLPQGVTWRRSSPGCDVTGRLVECTIDRLEINDPTSKEIVVRVNLATRDDLSSEATAEADEGNPSPSQAVVTPIAVSDLALGLGVSRVAAVAGRRLTYSLAVHNHGRFTATNVKVTLENHVDAGTVSFVSTLVPADCQAVGRRMTCTIERIAEGDTAVRLITVSVAPSTPKCLVSTTQECLVSTAQVSAEQAEPIPDLHSNSAGSTIGVELEADLSITKRGSPSEVVAGRSLTYSITVHNAGPSDSTGSTVRDVLPPRVSFVATQPAGCQGPCCERDGIVTCSVDQIPRGGDAQLSFEVLADSSLEPDPNAPVVLANTATIKGKEEEPPGASGPNTSEPVRTDVRVQADLRVTKKVERVAALGQPATDVCTGENLLYTVTVENCGPSWSRPAMMTDALDGVSFVASPDDGCSEKDAAVSCKIRALKPASACTSPVPEESATSVQFVAVVSADSAGSELSNVALVTGEDDDEGDMNRDGATVRVKRNADLEVTFSNPPELLIADGAPPSLTYTLNVENVAGANAENVAVTFELPEGAALSGDGCNEKVCTVGPLVAGGQKTIEARVSVPVDRNPLTVKASAADAGTCDPKAENNKATATTTVANAARLSLTKTAADTVVAGALLHYTLEVMNHGAAAAMGVMVEDLLPETLEFEPATQDGCSADGQLVTCSFDVIGPMSKGVRVFSVRVKTSATDYRLHNTATIRASDPTLAKPAAAAETLVLAGHLVLPFFKAAVEADSEADADTLLAVRNPSADSIGVRLDYFLAGEANADSCETPCLGMKQTLTRSLRDRFTGAGLKEGHVTITSIPSEECLPECDPAVAPPLLESPPQPPLSGDFVRVEPSAGHASGQLLVSTDTSRSPAELCRHWSTRFLNGGGFKGNTELFFFVPGNPGGSDPIVRGKVYEEKSGQFVQEISVTAAETAFRRTTQEGFDFDVPLLASFGTIEWEFAEGVVGNVSALHRAEGEFPVAVPGFCRRPPAAENLGPEPALLVPYFEVDSSAANTRFAAHNESDGEVKVRYDYFSADGTLRYTEAPPDIPALAAHATRTVSLRDQLAVIPELQGLTKGYLKIELDEQPAERKAPILSGDFVRINAQQRLASGGAMVDTDPHRSPPQLCHRWNVRFLQAAPLKTAFVFHLRTDGTGNPVSVKGTAYDENGAILKTVEIPGPLRTAFQMDGTDPLLSLDGNGFIDWTLQGVEGNLASILQGEGVSVLLPGVCVP